MLPNNLVKYLVVIIILLQSTLSLSADPSNNRERVSFWITKGRFQGLEASMVFENLDLDNPTNIRLLSFHLKYKRPKGSWKNSFQLLNTSDVMRLYAGSQAAHAFTSAGYPAIVLRLITENENISSKNHLIQHIVLFPDRKEAIFLEPGASTSNTITTRKIDIDPVSRGNFTKVQPMNAFTAIHPEDVTFISTSRHCEREFVSAEKLARIKKDIHGNLGR